jgi:hypothetical protein
MALDSRQWPSVQRHPRTVILSREDGEGSQNTYFEILRFAQDDGLP